VIAQMAQNKLKNIKNQYNDFIARMGPIIILKAKFCNGILNIINKGEHVIGNIRKYLIDEKIKDNESIIAGGQEKVCQIVENSFGLNKLIDNCSDRIDGDSSDDDTSDLDMHKTFLENIMSMNKQLVDMKDKIRNIIFDQEDDDEKKIDEIVQLLITP